MLSRNNLLSFKHHKECSALPIDEAQKVLQWAVENNASTRQTAEKVKEVKSWLAQGWTSDQLERKQMIEQGGQISQQGCQISDKAIDTKKELAKVASVSPDQIINVLF